MNQPEKILIVRLGSLGDILHTVPAQQLIHARLPNSQIHWLSDPSYVPLLNCVPGIQKVWPIDIGSWSALKESPHLLGLLKSLRKECFDVVIDFQGLVKSALLARIVGRNQILGFRAERFKEKGTGWFYSHRQEGESDLNQHVINSNLELIEQLVGKDAPSALIPFQIPIEDRNYVEKKLSTAEVKHPILINPGAGWVTKLWPASDYGRLARMIRERLGLPVVVTFGPGEEDLVEKMRREAGKTTLTAFPTSILQLAALCCCSRLMVAGDSGPLHLAVSVGTPTVAILGPTAANRNGPYSKEDGVVKRNLPCSNSYKRTCNKFICMDILPETVFDAVGTRLALTTRT